MLRCRCSSAAHPCSFLREDGSLQSAAAHLNGTGDLLAKFKRCALFGETACAGGDACGKAAGPAGVGRMEVLLEGGAKAPCKAQALATHAPMLSVVQRPLWSGAVFIALLREPVGCRYRNRYAAPSTCTYAGSAYHGALY